MLNVLTKSSSGVPITYNDCSYGIADLAPAGSYTQRYSSHGGAEGSNGDGEEGRDAEEYVPENGSEPMMAFLEMDDDAKRELAGQRSNLADLIAQREHSTSVKTALSMRSLDTRRSADMSRSIDMSRREEGLRKKSIEWRRTGSHMSSKSFHSGSIARDKSLHSSHCGSAPVEEEEDASHREYRAQDSDHRLRFAEEIDSRKQVDYGKGVSMDLAHHKRTASGVSWGRTSVVEVETEDAERTSAEAAYVDGDRLRTMGE